MRVSEGASQDMRYTGKEIRRWCPERHGMSS
jgi:hypothetical protein